MNLRPLVFAAAFLFTCSIASAQSKTTEALHKKHDEALALFFYNNTLRMINQKEDPAFDELIKDIEKMKFLLIKKDPGTFNNADYKKLKSDYTAESFEEIMTSRFEGKNFDIFIRGKENNTDAMLVLINDENNLFVLDILGSIALNKVTDLYNTLNQSSDIGKMISGFGGDDDDDKTEKRKEKKN
jgi:hypothetical protein